MSTAHQTSFSLLQSLFFSAYGNNNNLMLSNEYEARISDSLESIVVGLGNRVITGSSPVLFLS